MTDSDFLRPSVAEDAGYSAQHDPAEVVLDANESPYDLPEAIKEAIFDRLAETSYNRYPDSEAAELRELMADYLGVDSARLVAGNGSDELIGYLLAACVEPKDTIVIPTPTFSMYSILGSQYHGQVRRVPLSEDWNLTRDFLDVASGAKITFVGHPNNPTGNCFSRETIVELLETGSGLVVVDEAYAEFSRDSLIDLGTEYPSLVVLRTMSKAFGLAAARVGFLYANTEIIRGINTVRLPYNLNTLSQVTAEETLRNRERVLGTVDKILRERENLVDFLDEQGLNPSPSDSNFILFKPDDPERLYDVLLEKGIRIRSFSGERIEDYLRVTVGTPEQNARFREAVVSA